MSDSIVALTISIIYKSIKILHLAFTARAELNPNEDRMPLATSLQIQMLIPDLLLAHPELIFTSIDIQYPH